MTAILFSVGRLKLVNFTEIIECHEACLQRTRISGRYGGNRDH